MCRAFRAGQDKYKRHGATKAIKIFYCEANQVFGQPSLPAIALVQARQAGRLTKSSAWVCG